MKGAALALAIAAGLGVSALVSRQLERSRPPAPAVSSDEPLYLSPQAARRMSLSFNGLAADWYWMRSLQYVGRRVVEHRGDLRLDDLSPLNLVGLAPLLEQTTTLDPEFMAAYEFGAVVLPAVDEGAAVRFIEKGIRENPTEWRLLHHLGYIHWTRGRFREAADAYARGAEVAGAPAWMRMMAAQMEAQGGSRDTARAIYGRMLEESDDENVRNLARLRLAQVDSLEARDQIRRLLSAFRAQTGRCPQNWRDIAGALRAARLRTNDDGAPLDPAGFPYLLDPAACEVNLNTRTPIPRK